jgi:hypothetical protein
VTNGVARDARLIIGPISGKTGVTKIHVPVKLRSFFCSSGSGFTPCRSDAAEVVRVAESARRAEAVAKERRRGHHRLGDEREQVALVLEDGDPGRLVVALVLTSPAGGPRTGGSSLVSRTSAKGGPI